MDNNYQNGYQGQNGYPQQPQQNMYQQPQQNMYQQPQQNMYQQPQQNMYQQPQQPPQQPAKAPKKKSKTGLVVGIIIAVLVVLAGVLVFLFRDKLFGSKIKGGYDSPEELCKAYWEGMAECDKDKLGSCFIKESKDYDKVLDANYSRAKEIKDEITIDTKNIKVSTGTYLVKQIDYDIELKEAKTVHIEVPMTQIVDGTEYEIIDIYDGVAIQVKSNKKWYLKDLDETDVKIEGFDDVTTEDITEDTEEDITEDTEEYTEETTATTEEAVDDTVDGKTVGDATNGYVTLPGEWVTFIEAEDIADVYYTWAQFSRPDQSAILTLCTYDDLDDPEQAATNIYAYMEGEGAQDLTGATVYIGGYEAKQVYGYYQDYDLYLVTYFFLAPDVDNLLHYVAIEFHPGDEGLVKDLENTFTF